MTADNSPQFDAVSESPPPRVTSKQTKTPEQGSNTRPLSPEQGSNTRQLSTRGSGCGARVETMIIRFLVCVFCVSLLITVVQVSMHGPKGGAGDIPYYIMHMLITWQIFAFVAFLHYALCIQPSRQCLPTMPGPTMPLQSGANNASNSILARTRRLDGSLLSGFCTSLTFYTSREVRDHEKLGYIDWPGILWPVGGVLVLWVPLQVMVWRAQKRNPPLVEPVDDNC